MSTLVETQVGQLVLSDGQDRCTVHITIKTLSYNSGGYFYDISYSYTVSQGADYLHPFGDKPNSAEGDILAKNSMTEEMVKFLLMDTDTLSKVCGNTHPDSYKVGIMRALANLWD